VLRKLIIQKKTGTFICCCETSYCAHPSPTPASPPQESFRMWEETGEPGGNPRRHRESVQTPHSDPSQESKPVPWRCEAAMLSTVPPMIPIKLHCCFKYQSPQFHESLVCNCYQRHDCNAHGFDLLLSHILIYSEKYCCLHTIQTNHTIHGVRRKGEGAECSVTVIARVWRKINLIRSRSIQRSDGSREEGILESIGP